MISRHDIESAHALIGEHILNKPVRGSKLLSELCDCTVRMKLENFQMTGAFKERGAANKLGRLTDEQKARGVVAASAGNHAQGIACAAKRLGITARIVMPTGTPLIKVSGVEYWGAEVILHGQNYDEACDFAVELAEQDNATFVHPFADYDVMAGQGTVALEILNDPLGQDLDAIIVPVGGGGLIAGVATYVKEVRPDIQIIGVEAESSPGMLQSIKAGKVVEIPAACSIADGINVRRVAEETLQLVQTYVDKIVTVTPDEISNAILMMLEIEKIVVEGAGAVGIAALRNGKLPQLAGKNVLTIVSGGNIDSNLLSRIITRGLAFGGRIASLQIDLRDAPGALEDLTKVFRSHNANILEISHHRFGGLNPLGEIKVSVILETRSHEHIAELISSLRADGYPTRYDTPRPDELNTGASS